MYICRKLWFDHLFFENHDKLNIKKFGKSAPLDFFREIGATRRDQANVLLTHRAPLSCFVDWSARSAQNALDFHGPFVSIWPTSEVVSSRFIRSPPTTYTRPPLLPPRECSLPPPAPPGLPYAKAKQTAVQAPRYAPRNLHFLRWFPLPCVPWGLTRRCLWTARKLCGRCLVYVSTSFVLWKFNGIRAHAWRIGRRCESGRVSPGSNSMIAPSLQSWLKVFCSISPVMLTLMNPKPHHTWNLVGFHQCGSDNNPARVISLEFRRGRSKRFGSRMRYCFVQNSHYFSTIVLETWLVSVICSRGCLLNLLGCRFRNALGSRLFQWCSRENHTSVRKLLEVDGTSERSKLLKKVCDSLAITYFCYLC
jgi:hypothetical protein